MSRAGWVFAATCWTALALPARALAGEPDVAEQLFQEGHALLKEQRYSEACPKFAESQLHDPASGTLLALAYCQELGGSLASSRASYLAAVALAHRENQPEREQAAKEHALALAARISTLTIDVPATLLQLPSLRITQNGVNVALNDLGKPIDVDGGVYAITVTAAGRPTWSERVAVELERDHRTVNVPESLAPIALGSPRATAELAATVPVRVDPAPHYWTTPRIVGWSAIGAGAVTGALAAYFAVATKSAQDDVEAAALRSIESQTSPTGTRIPWDSSGHAREVDGKRDAALAQGFAFTSGALLVGGAALVIFGSETHERAPANLSLAITPSAAELGYSGSF